MLRRGVCRRRQTFKREGEQTILDIADGRAQSGLIKGSKIAQLDALARPTYDILSCSPHCQTALPVVEVAEERFGHRLTCLLQVLAREQSGSSVFFYRVDREWLSWTLVRL